MRLAMMFLVAAVTMTSAIRGQAADNEDVLKPAAVEELVRAHGGRVDFVFEEERAFPSCHASTLACAPDGTLMCAWFGGKEEKDPDVAIWLSRFVDGAWATPVKVAKVNETAHWNPVLFNPGDGKVYLFFKVGPQIPEWQTYWKQSADNGVTWSDAVELVPGDHGGRGPVRCKPIVLSDGAWLAGASTEKGGWRPFADRSEDSGKTWTRSEDFEIEPKELRGRGAIQPTLWERAPGMVRAYMRSQGGRIWATDSADYGKTWSKVFATELPNNNSGIDFLNAEGFGKWMVYNPVGQSGGVRSPLSLAKTEDGDHWTRFADLENEPMKEFSYPAMIQTKDGGIAISYTWKRERIRVWQIAPGTTF